MVIWGQPNNNILLFMIVKVILTVETKLMQVQFKTLASEV